MVSWLYTCITILFIINLSIISINADNVENSNKRYFYIYDWDKALDDVWPPAGAKLHVKSGYNHDFRDNYGAGRMLDEKVGLFQTWQFSLYKVVMNRLRVSEFRTRCVYHDT